MSHLLQLLLLLALIIAAAKLAGAAAARIGQPAVFGEILIGLLLGPTLLNILGWPLFSAVEAGHLVAAPPLLSIVRDLAEVGVILLMFIAGTTMVTPPLLRLTFPRPAARPRAIVEETIAGPPEETEVGRG